MTTALEHWHRHGWERTAGVTADFVAFVRSHALDRLDQPVPDMDWRAIDVVAPVASVFRRYTVNPERSNDAAEVAEQNDTPTSTRWTSPSTRCSRTSPAFTWELENMAAHARLGSAWFSDSGLAIQARTNGANPSSTSISSALYNRIPL